MNTSLCSWQNCICTRSFGGQAAILAALPQEASAKGAGIVFALVEASSLHSPSGFFSSTKPKLCARERSRRLRRLEEQEDFVFLLA